MNWNYDFLWFFEGQFFVTINTLLLKEYVLSNFSLRLWELGNMAQSRKRTWSGKELHDTQCQDVDLHPSAPTLTQCDKQKSHEMIFSEFFSGLQRHADLPIILHLRESDMVVASHLIKSHT